MVEFPDNLCNAKHLIFIYTNIIGYQYVGDAKTTLLRVIDSKQLLKNGSICELEPNIYYKKILSNTIHLIFIELRIETGKSVPLFRDRKTQSDVTVYKIWRIKQWNQTTPIKHLLFIGTLSTNK